MSNEELLRTRLERAKNNLIKANLAEGVAETRLKEAVIDRLHRLIGTNLERDIRDLSVEDCISALELWKKAETSPREEPVPIEPRPRTKAQRPIPKTKSV